MINPTIIIGAGPAGLAIAGQLAHHKVPFTVLEASEYIGYAWRQHYDRLHLHTVKEHSALPHLPFPDHYPRYVSRLQLVEYMERYAEHFGIKPLFNQQVTGIRRDPNGHWLVDTRTDQFTAPQVVVATGYNRIPYQPELPGQRNFRGIIWHSRDYRNGAPFAGEQVLVVGMGNTGAEIALDLYEYKAKPFISVRGPVNVVKRDMFGRPTQPTAIFLNKFPNWFYDLMAGLSQRLTVGNLSAYGLQKPPYPPSYQIRKLGRIPVIDLGTLDQIKAGHITVVPGIQQVNAKSVTFTDNREIPFDAIIMATGYRPGLAPILGPLADRILDEKGYPRRMWFTQPELAGLYFLGFTTPLTGILRSIHMDSERVLQHLLKHQPMDG
ncbi:NAD(P)/FAD-dependent oxidoreductase [Nibrella saemangeumensis]|uniref:NAD(P)/FAD-dependent oxidoreductase n=1 Tax=Nibrella saemangeumensis TaxID=1084526 RepID=A0ABP8N1B2_9BACT